MCTCDKFCNIFINIDSNKPSWVNLFNCLTSKWFSSAILPCIMITPLSSIKEVNLVVYFQNYLCQYLHSEKMINKTFKAWKPQVGILFRRMHRKSDGKLSERLRNDQIVRRKYIRNSKCQTHHHIEFVLKTLCKRACTYTSRICECVQVVEGCWMCLWMEKMWKFVWRFSDLMWTEQAICGKRKALFSQYSSVSFKSSRVKSDFSLWFLFFFENKTNSISTIFPK